MTTCPKCCCELYLECNNDLMGNEIAIPALCDRCGNYLKY